MSTSLLRMFSKSVTFFGFRLLQGSVATYRRWRGSLSVRRLHREFSHESVGEKKIENRFIFAEVIIKYQVASFFETQFSTNRKSDINGLSNGDGAIFTYLEQPLTQFSRPRHSLMFKLVICSKSYARKQEGLFLSERLYLWETRKSYCSARHSKHTRRQNWNIIIIIIK